MLNSSDLRKLISSIPPDVIALRNSGNLHKLAEARTGIPDFGLDSAVYQMAKKAYYRRRVNTAILEGIAATEASTRK